MKTSQYEHNDNSLEKVSQQMTELQDEFNKAIQIKIIREEIIANIKDDKMRAALKLVCKTYIGESGDEITVKDLGITEDIGQRKSIHDILVEDGYEAEAIIFEINLNSLGYTKDYGNW